MATTAVEPAKPKLEDILAPIRQRITGGVNPAPIAGSENWKYDPAYDAATQSVQTGLAQLGAGVNTAERRANEDYDRNAGLLRETKEKTLRSLANRMGNQGMGFSSFNIDEQGNISSDFLKGMDTLGRETTRGLEDVATNTLNQVNQLGSILSGAQADRANRETDAQNQQAMRDAIDRNTTQQASDTRSMLTEITENILKQLTPQPTPTGALTLPPPRMPSLPKPPPAPTPQMQLAGIGVAPMDLQKHLQLRGFDPGPIDGVMGKMTQTALAQWKQSVGLPATADITPEIWQQLLSTGVGNLAANNPATGGSLSGNRFPTSGPAKRVMI